MTGSNGETPEQFILALSATASPDLNAQLQQFVRSPEQRDSSDSSPSELGRTALRAFELISARKVSFIPPRQIDRGHYGEGDGLVLGRYLKALDSLSRSKLMVDNESISTGFKRTSNGIGHVWITLSPSVMERQALVQPPLFSGEQLETPDLRMELLIPPTFVVSEPEAALALSALREHIAADHTQYLASRDEAKKARLAAQEKGQEYVGPNPKRTLYLQQLHLKKTRIQVAPSTATQGTSDSAA